MMDQNYLEFDGKKYISSARAAGLVGYTKDYVGQLARAGKLEARLVGRNWYVSEDSIRKHKLAVHYTLTKPKKSRSDELYTENTIQRKDISLTNDSDNDSDIVTEDRKVETPPRTTVRSGDFARQELVRADVRFETGESLEYDAGSYVPKLRSVSAVEVTSSPVNPPAREVTPPEIRHNLHREAVKERSHEVQVRRFPGRQMPPSHTGRLQRVDGITVVSRSEKPMNDRKPEVPGGRLPSLPNQSRNHSSVDVVHRELVSRPSKRMPVLAGLTVFALFCLWYWVFR